MKPIRLALLALLALLAASCSSSREESLNLAPTPPLSGGPGWAVVKEAYARLKGGPSPSSEDLSHLRRGDLVELSGRDLGSASSPGAARGVWFKLKAGELEGWARAEDLDVFPTKAQAERAASKYR